MPRRKLNKKRVILPDPVYNSVTVHMLINRVLKDGKKSLASTIVYETLNKLKVSTDKNPIKVLEKALQHVTPQVEMKAQRKVGRLPSAMVPMVLRAGNRPKAIALRWILEGCKKRTGQSMIARLHTEILDAYNKTGYAVRKKDDLHRVATSHAMYAKKPQTVINAINSK
uniref:Ribosomal protein S7 n=1 Tax=Polytoma uvella TaxID=40532 RepID=A0A1L2M5B5_9CHLO|nr:ribosomal protein S7 [Polytoma uvella]